jgi:hypothetical protein
MVVDILTDVSRRRWTLDVIEESASTVPHYGSFLASPHREALGSELRISGFAEFDMAHI